MNYRALGKTGLKVSEVGMGTWQLAGSPWGWDLPDEDESMRALHRFIELGGNFIDTAWVYGRSPKNKASNRHSAEELIGEFIIQSGGRDKLILASKIPPKNDKWPAWQGVKVSEVFPDQYIENKVDDTLKNMRIDFIDLMQFHVWQDDFVNDDGWKNTIQKITKKGKVKHWGISINDYQPSNCIKTLDTGLISTIQLIFNIYHQQPIERLFPYIRQNNIGLIVRVPLDEGGLTGTLTSSAPFTGELREYYFSKDRLSEAIAHQEALKLLLGKEANSIPELALRYILSWPEVSSVIPGMRKVKNVESNLSVSDKRLLSPNLLVELKKHVWERNFYPDIDPSMASSNYLEP